MAHVQLPYPTTSIIRAFVVFLEHVEGNLYTDQPTDNRTINSGYDGSYKLEYNKYE